MRTVEQNLSRRRPLLPVRWKDAPGCSVGDGHTKNLRPRKGIERNTSRTLPSYVFQKVHFGSKYSGVLRSPQKLKMFWGPHSRAL